MRALEMNSEYFGVSRLQLMENAGKSIADQIKNRFKPPKTRVAVFCGLGGNGGDGFVSARHLLNYGFRVEIILAGKSEEITDKEAKTNWNALQQLKGNLTIHEIYDSSLTPDVKTDVIIDALLGIGLKGAPRPPIRQLITQINKTKSFVLAADVPTGIDSDSGEVLEEAVEADLTVTFHKIKPGLVKAKKHAGELVVTDIGLPEQFEGFAGPGDVQMVVKPRSAESHKGDFGRLLVIGGNEVFSGAPVLVASAAYRTVVDLVHIAAPVKTAYAISSMSPDLITIKLDGDHLNPHNVATLNPYLEKSTAVAIGPGLGLHKETREFMKEMVKQVESKRIPLLLDADGLKAFAEFKHQMKSPTVFTPHSGEYKILTGHEAPKELEERATDLQKTAEELGAVVLLKGHTDVISDGKRVKFNFTGNPGMTVGGTGDVLSGIVAAFLAQGIEPFEAAVAGAFINGAAGDFVASEKGFHMVATDLLEWIPSIIDDPMSHLKVRKLG
jgi:NAD(P)H-hydrate epimerase